MSTLVAAAHVDAVVARFPDAASYDRDAWTAAVVAHLKPLPADRLWRLLAARRRPSWIGHLAPQVAGRFTPAHGTRPPVECPVWCRATHKEAA